MTAHGQTVQSWSPPAGTTVISQRVVSAPAPGTIVYQGMAPGTMIVQAPADAPPAATPPAATPVDPAAPPAAGTPAAEPTQSPEGTRAAAQEGERGETPTGPTYGPASALDSKILQNFVRDLCGKGDDIDPCTGKKKAPWLNFAGWIDADYTYRSIGGGQNNVAPVMNRFGNEFLGRDIGLYFYKSLDETTWSWGFNALFITGSDASFLTPTAGGWKNTNPRYGADFTDLNLTAHLPILTDGGVDIKAGRQTTCLGPMGAIPWQRTFDSSDYAWYNEEEGRYTGVSAVWHVTKQLDWYNGAEIGGWGVFFDDPARAVDYLTQITYWLDKEAKKHKVWTTVLTGPTGFTKDGNTTVVEVGYQENWTSRIYQIIDTQLTYSKAPIFGTPPPGYQERAYDVYTYLGYHLTEQVDLNSRVEWYDDVDGGGYPGGFGKPHTNYEEYTVGFDYHPVKWLQLRPEIRYDHADNPNFGKNYDHKNELTIAGDILLKF